MKKFPLTFIPNRKNPHKIDAVTSQDENGNLTFVDKKGAAVMLLDFAKAAIDKLKYVNVSEALYSKKIYSENIESDSIKLENEDLKTKIESLSSQISSIESNVKTKINEFQAAVNDNRKDILGLSFYNRSSSSSFNWDKKFLIGRNRAFETGQMKIEGPSSEHRSPKFGNIRVAIIISLSNVKMNGSGDRVLRCEINKADKIDGNFSNIGSLDFVSKDETLYNAYSQVYIDKFAYGDAVYKLKFDRISDDGTIEIGNVNISVLKL